MLKNKSNMEKARILIVEDEDDWRLPNQFELESILDIALGSDPLINRSTIPNTQLGNGGNGWKMYSPSTSLKLVSANGGAIAFDGGGSFCAAVGYLTKSMHGAGSPQAKRIMISRLVNL